MLSVDVNKALLFSLSLTLFKFKHKSKPTYLIFGRFDHRVDFFNYSWRSVASTVIEKKKLTFDASDYIFTIFC